MIVLQDVNIDEEVDVIISEWMGYMLLYEVAVNISVFMIVYRIVRFLRICIPVLFYGLQLYDIFPFLLLACLLFPPPIIEYAGKCDHSKRSLAKTWRFNTSFKCNGILLFV